MPLCPRCRKKGIKSSMEIKKRKIKKGLKTVVARRPKGGGKWEYYEKEVKKYSGVVHRVWWCPKCKFSIK